MFEIVLSLVFSTKISNEKYFRPKIPGAKYVRIENDLRISSLLFDMISNDW